MAFYGDNQIVEILNYMTQYVTGSEFLTILMIVIIIVALCLLFRLPLSLTIPLVLPLLIAISIGTGEIVSVLGVALIYAAILLAKKWIAN